MLKSAESDSGYYIQNYALVADHEINLEHDPAPDLVVEVDITRTGINKNRLYASLGVSEFWRFNGQEWKILSLVDGVYAERDRSPTFPLIAKTDLYQFLEAALLDKVSAEVNFRQWVQQQLKNS